ncbi:pyruvate/2-oxoglutarate dehydrogenase complex, dihydrolipoamide dehydrogenase component [Beggiatoa alba B18LD]|uniref:Pyruvate/2-oxoglutarate dehydrogenase complex, dihydrolipoamide dehydrogenase component n=1 Tax=Beggiatoa alba B18LD TaxID=395493 RepID=I3CIG0_9GAMM|nr:bifunctional TVP38/TMEM64 family protein/FAD-dependent oxidoreductase [Beggiatoa alba]EIJ43403.1 pyruvate/2-oxoglutarate dehydrogenase complex, dihydrolipoamide dehydrogenase component [Beggiatoa alba B18LD]
MKKLIVFLVLIVCIVSFFSFDFHQYFNLNYVKTQHLAFESYTAHHPIEATFLFSVIYIITTALSLPGAALLTLLGGALFGVVWGVVIVSFASTIGATLAFLTARFLLQEFVQTHFSRYIDTINAGIEKEGHFYLFTLRLVPLFPFFIINLVMGLTTIRLWTYYWVSQVGMLLGTIVYVNAGTQLAELDSLSGILSPDLLLSFTLLGIFPLLAKKLLTLLRYRRYYAQYPKPKRFDRDMVVIGGGAAGLISAYIAATVNAKVTLIEKEKMGGDCLNTGCVPSKALIRSCRFLYQLSQSAQYGCQSAVGEFSFSDVMARVQRIIKTIEPHDSIERYTALGVECLQGEARILDPYHVQIREQVLSTRNIIIATGARPFIPDIQGIEQVNYYTSDTIWQIREQPQRLLILGGGAIGCELGQCFARLGSHVTIVQTNERLLPREDADITALLAEKLQAESIHLRLSHQPLYFEQWERSQVLWCEHQGERVALEFDALLIAVGRVANTQGFGLENLQIALNSNKTIAHNDFLQTTNYPTIYVCGDVANPYQYTNVCAHEAWFASVNALFGTFKKFRVDYRFLPHATFTDPEIARVGLNEQEARAANIPYEVTYYHLDDLDRAIADDVPYGMIKVLTAPKKAKILGVSIVGEHASEIISEFVLAMKHNIGINQLLAVPHIYPTFAEANKYVAGRWKQARKPEKLLKRLSRYHAWRRGE